MKFTEIVNNYLLFKEVKGKPQSIRSIKSRIKNYVLPYFKKYNIEDIDPKKYIEWQEHIETLNFSYKYKKTLHYTMVSIFNYAKLFYNYDNNVPSKVGNFNNCYNIPREVNVWDYEEFKLFIKAIDKNRINDNDIIYKILYSFMYFTGCRLGECLALTFDDLNDDVININKTISKEFINGKRQITTPKTKKSIRKIHIDHVLKNELNNLREYYSNITDLFQENWYIFGGKEPLSPTTVERRKNLYCEIANIKKIRLHDFRHSHASLLLSSGVPISAISERLGHSDITTTMNVYIHLIPKDEEKVLTAINTLRLAK